MTFRSLILLLLLLLFIIKGLILLYYYMATPRVRDGHQRKTSHTKINNAIFVCVIDHLSRGIFFFFFSTLITVIVPCCRCLGIAYYYYYGLHPAWLAAVWAVWLHGWRLQKPSQNERVLTHHCACNCSKT